MAYVNTYVCDFDKCRSLADAACVFCEKHGCYKHLPKAIRVAFEYAEGFLAQPALPLPGIAVHDVTAPILLFGERERLKRDGKAEDFPIAREFCEQLACDECCAEIGTLTFPYREAGGDAAIRAALHTFISTLRAAFSTRRLTESETNS